MRKKTIIVDYELGNLFSVLQACMHVGLDTEVSSDPAKVASADALILPGVGAFGAAMANLRRNGTEAALKAHVVAGKPFLGICLGMQLLFKDSMEFGLQGGLSLLPGKVIRIPGEIHGQKAAVPQIGWNQVMPPPHRKWPGTPLEHLVDGAYMYFVHSYYVVPDHPRDCLALTDYMGLEYCSAIQKDNILAFQFHPEKSGHGGVEIYRKWGAMNGML
jgi:glutamine amidotransferase